VEKRIRHSCSGTDRHFWSGHLGIDSKIIQTSVPRLHLAPLHPPPACASPGITNHKQSMASSIKARMTSKTLLSFLSVVTVIKLSQMGLIRNR
jgi:hypothetical protein